MKILLLGKNGILGSSFRALLSRNTNFEVIALDIDDLDITDYDSLKDTFERISPDLLLNCAAYTAVDDCEKNYNIARKVNADAVFNMAGLCNKSSIPIVHFSTDYVFSGEKPDGYVESDNTDPINAYGRSKLEGEQGLMNNTDKYYLVRTSWLYGKGGRNFVDTMLDLASGRDCINVVNDQIGSPTFANDLAEKVVDEFLTEGKKSPYGIYHFTNSDACSWYDFAKEIFSLSGVDISLNPVSSKDFPTAAKRPRFSILQNTKTPPLRSWQSALEDYL